MAKGPCQFGGSPAELYAIFRRALGSYSEVMPPFRMIRKAFQQTEKEISEASKKLGEEVSKFLGDIFSKAWADVFKLFKLKRGSAAKMVSQISDFFSDAGKIISEIVGAQEQLSGAFAEGLKKEAWRALVGHASKAEEELRKFAKKHEAIFGNLSVEVLRERIGLFVQAVNQEVLARKKLPELAGQYANLAKVFSGILLESLPSEEAIGSGLKALEKNFREWQNVLIVSYLRMLGIDIDEAKLQFFVGKLLKKVKPSLDEIGVASEEAYKWIEQLAKALTHADVSSPKLLAAFLFAFTQIARDAGVLEDALARLALKLEREAARAAQQAAEATQQAAEKLEEVQKAAQQASQAFEKAAAAPMAAAENIGEAADQQKATTRKFSFSFATIKNIFLNAVAQTNSFVSKAVAALKILINSWAAVIFAASVFIKIMKTLWNTLIAPVEERAKFSALLASTRAVTEFTKRLTQISLAQRGGLAASYANWAWRFFFTSFSEIFLFVKKIWDYLSGTLLLTIGLIARILNMVFWVLNKILEAVEWLVDTVLWYLGFVREGAEQVPLDMLFNRLLTGDIPTRNLGRLVPPSQWERKAGDF